jgi:hypothetical protein
VCFKKKNKISDDYNKLDPLGRPMCYGWSSYMKPECGSCFWLTSCKELLECNRRNEIRKDE